MKKRYLLAAIATIAFFILAGNNRDKFPTRRQGGGSRGQVEVLRWSQQ